MSTIYGGSGDDVVSGGSGNDTLAGGVGNDTDRGGYVDFTVEDRAGGDMLCAMGGLSCSINKNSYKTNAPKARADRFQPFAISSGSR